MNKEFLMKILDALVKEPPYSDIRIKQEEYDKYVGILNRAEKNGPCELNDKVNNIFYSLNICLPQNARNIAYPFNFSKEVEDWKKKQITVNGNIWRYDCAICGTHIYDSSSGDKKLEPTIDHYPSLSYRFNHGEYNCSRSKRQESYNKDLRLVCRSKNSELGGEDYNKEYIAQVYINEN